MTAIFLLNIAYSVNHGSFNNERIYDVGKKMNIFL